MTDNFTIELEGAEELKKLFNEFPASVVKRARKSGVRKAGARFRTLLRHDAPKITGNLKKSIGIYKKRSGGVKVGLTVKLAGSEPGKFGAGKRIRFYYKTLDLNSKRGRALNPWFLSSAKRHSHNISRLMISETKKALYLEAGKAYARSKSKLKGR